MTSTEGLTALLKRLLLLGQHYCTTHNRIYMAVVLSRAGAHGDKSPALAGPLFSYLSMNLYQKDRDTLIEQSL